MQAAGYLGREGAGSGIYLDSAPRRVYADASCKERTPIVRYEAPRIDRPRHVEALTLNGDTGQGGGLDCKERGKNGLKDNYGVDLNIQSQPQEGLGSCSA